MKLRRKSNNSGKGAPSGLVISLLFHAAAFFLAGLFVVFTVVNKKDPEFVQPPKVERPRMKLKKPKVKVQKSSKPKPSSRIVAKVKSREMPEIKLPDLVGTGEGLMGGAGLGGEFLDLPDFTKNTVFGEKGSTGSDLKATYYDLNRSRNGNSRGNVEPMAEFGKVVARFIQTGCSKTSVAEYFRSEPLYSPGVMIPRVLSPVGPAAFGQDRARPQGWFVHYEGKLVHPTDIRFRFWGYGDDALVVLVDKEVVLSAGVAYSSPKWVGYVLLTPDWHPSGASIDTVYMAGGKAGWGDWIDLKGGEVHDIDIIVGESPGGHFSAMLNVQVDGVKYEKTSWGSPILPMFKTDELSWAQQDAIYEYMTPGESCLTNGPIFRDY